MTDPETHLSLHHLRAVDLHAQADAHRLAAQARQPRHLRTRVGWTLVEIGLRLATPPQPTVATG
ncbi:hypothetical protein ACQF36_38525 [Streptomyces sp. Marseille-Q5077]|uniref:hypothetical protein n=1 Tax=Streptomyces sp. Marseille-Q5077 TaxID=3418995 RepID=UPI003D0952D4